MLLGAGRRRYETSSARDSVHNYYEQMVFDQVMRASDRALRDSEFMADVACVALNRLPPRYVRHDVDMTFFLSPIEMEEMTNKVVNAVNEALSFVTGRENNHEERSSENFAPENQNPPEVKSTKKKGNKKSSSKK